MPGALTDEQIERLSQLAEDYPSFKADLADLRSRLEQGDDRKELRTEFDELKKNLNEAMKERTDEHKQPERPVSQSGPVAKTERSGFSRAMPWNAFSDDDEG
jgi:regulator of replication initiation timing